MIKYALLCINIHRHVSVAADNTTGVFDGLRNDRDVSMNINMHDKVYFNNVHLVVCYINVNIP